MLPVVVFSLGGSRPGELLQGLSSLISLLRRANERKAELFSLLPQCLPGLSAQEALKSALKSQKEEALQL